MGYGTGCDWCGKDQTWLQICQSCYKKVTITEKKKKKKKKKT